MTSLSLTTNFDAPDPFALTRRSSMHDAPPTGYGWDDDFYVEDGDILDPSPDRRPLHDGVTAQSSCKASEGKGHKGLFASYSRYQ